MTKTIYSVVIRTKDSARTIKDCINSLLEQEVPPNEIIIVDSGSSDNTLDVISEFEICKVVYYPFDGPFNYSKSLNIGIKEATEELILNFSSHCILKHSNTTKLMIDFLEENKMALAVSLGGAQNEKREVCKPRTQQTMSYELINRYNFKGHAMNNPCALLYKKHWRERPFNENYDRAEDQEWAHYWITKDNYFTAIIMQPSLIYDNRNFGRDKVAMDLLTLGKELHPYYRSNLFFFRLVWSLKFFSSENTNNYRLLMKLLYFKYFSRKKY